MSKSVGSLFSRKRQSAATFVIDEDFSAGWRKRNKAKRMGLGRTISSALSLTLGFGAAYVALHYVPAMVSPSQILRVSDLDERSLASRPEGVMGVLAPYWESLQTRRSYLRPGESVEVQYRLDSGNTLDLVVERCARQLVREVFDCTVVSQEVVRVTGRTGTQRLYFSEPGFYHFKERQAGESRVIWRRV